MQTVTLLHVIDAESLASELAGLTDTERRRFATELCNALWNEDEVSATAFAEAFDAQNTIRGEEMS